MSRKLAKKITGPVLANTSKETLVKALNFCNFEFDDSFKKQQVMAYCKANKINTAGFSSLADFDFRVTGSLIYINENMMVLGEKELATLQSRIAGLKAAASKFVVKTQVAAPKVSIRDRMMVKVEQYTADIEDALSPLFQKQACDFDINAFIKINNLPRNVCKLVAERLQKNLIDDVDSLVNGVPEFVEAYSFLGKREAKGIAKVLKDIVDTLNVTKTVKKVPVRQVKTTSTVSRGVLRGIAQQMFKDGKTNKEVAAVMVKTYGVKPATATSYASGFKKEMV